MTRTRTPVRSGALLLLIASAILLGPALAAAAVEEVIEVPGAANPLDAPLLGSGAVVDTILQSETLWYAVDAAPGQEVQVTVVLLGRPDGPQADDTALTATFTDPQRQPLQEGEASFDGRTDSRVELAAAAIPAVSGDRPLLSVSLASAAGLDSLEGTGYRLQLTVLVEGTPLPAVEAADTDGAADPDEIPPPAVTAPPVVPPAGPDLVGDLAPFALIALAVGGVAGFELSRRGL
ncbi:hypothetical protein BH23ACT9_BH23ACT9_10620 [soil metagenome]